MYLIPIKEGADPSRIRASKKPLIKATDGRLAKGPNHFQKRIYAVVFDQEGGTGKAFILSARTVPLLGGVRGGLLEHEIQFPKN